MKKLIIDRDGFQLHTRKALIEEVLTDSIVDTVTELKDLYHAFKKGIYDVVVIDNTIEEGQEYVDYILKTDPLQPILVVSNSNNCVVERCSDCVAHYNIRNLNNPTPIKNIIRMITGFNSYPCDHYDDETLQE